MDPVTILSLIGESAAIAKAVFETSLALYNFIQDVRDVDDNLTALYHELESLSAVISSIDTVLQSAAAKQDEDRRLWADVDACLRACHKTVTDFYTTLKQFETTKPKAGFTVRNALRVAHLRFDSEKIDRTRKQVQTHIGSMQVLFAMINFRIGASTNTAVTKEMIPKLDSLPDDVAQKIDPKLELLIHMVEELKRDEMLVAIVDNEPGILESRAKLMVSAEDMISNATTIEGSRSTMWGGSEPELNSGHFAIHSVLPTRVLRQAQTTGSEFGEPLNTTKRSMIDTWIPAIDNVIDEEESSVEMASTTLSGPSHESGDSQTTKNSDVYIEQNLEESEDEDDLVLELAQSLLKRGRQRLADQAFADAEAPLTRAMKIWSAVSVKHARDIDIRDIQLDLAAANLGSGNLTRAKELCEIIIRDPAILHDKDRGRVLDAAYLLSQVHLAQGSLEDARQECQRTVRARRRLSGKTQPYFETVALMIAICEAQEDVELAAAYTDFLPDGFESPKFKGSKVVFTATPSSPHLSASNLSSPERTGSTAFDSLPDDGPRISTLVSRLRPPVAPRGYKPKTFEEQSGKVVHNIKTPKGMSTINKAALPELSESETKEALRFLSQYLFVGQRPGEKGFNANEALSWAAASGNTVAINLLVRGHSYVKTTLGFRPRLITLKEVTNLDYDDKVTGTPLNYAAYRGRFDCIKMLLDLGANARLESGEYGRTTLSYAMANRKWRLARDELKTITLLLIEHGVDVDARDILLDTPLMEAACSGFQEPIKTLLAAKADIGCVNDRGYTALCHAILEKRDGIVALLKSRGATCPHPVGFVHTFRKE